MTRSGFIPLYIGVIATEFDAKQRITFVSERTHKIR